LRRAAAGDLRDGRIDVRPQHMLLRSRQPAAHDVLVAVFEWLA
jgi:hypothetical protein